MVSNKIENNRAKIKEIFSSIQGEGLCIGCKQVFVRFCACNLNCKYCDTDFYPTNINDKNTFYEFTPDELVQYLRDNFDLENIHSVSLTGGEPLIWTDFLKEFLAKLDVKFYLETNATIADNAKIILPLVDIVSADIKLPSCSGIDNSFELHDKFFDVVINSVNKSGLSYSSANGNFYAKLVFDKNITDVEIAKATELARKYDCPIILQPKMINDKLSVKSEFIMNTLDKFLSLYKNTRLIPQVHKFIDVE